MWVYIYIYIYNTLQLIKRNGIEVGRVLTAQRKREQIVCKHIFDNISLETVRLYPIQYLNTILEYILRLL